MNLAPAAYSTHAHVQKKERGRFPIRSLNPASVAGLPFLSGWGKLDADPHKTVRPGAYRLGQVLTSHKQKRLPKILLWVLGFSLLLFR